ncbi:a1-alpha2 repression [Entomortierella chlamydospora]|uniref:A1-alpha2 repression n=1 Tax=Entomortierella chlamydospora TaxID=101097 RepID=A0A9P6MRI3_9FUNG|nr:a1-alpha2 repression [Entomortierella chlamydospora]
MDNETLKKLFKAGAILLVLDAPHNQLEFGIDVNCWNTGPRFRGIKIIPPGAHFVYYSLHNTKSAKSSTDESVKEAGTVEVTEGGPTGGDVRIGFWHQFESGEVVVMKWNAYNEEMELEKDHEQIARYKAESIFKDDGFVNSQDDLLDEELSRASKIIDRQQKEEAEKVTKEKLKQESQLGRTTDTILEEDETEANIEMEAESEVHMEAQIETSKLRKKTEVNTRNGSVDFTTINLRSSFQKGAVGEEVTRYSLDKSWLLNHLFTTAYRSDISAFLGEYQVAFVTMLLSYHLGAFRQWKNMTILVCQSAEAIASPNYTRLFSEFIQTLNQQLTSIPSSFFMDLLFASPDQDDMTANFLEQALKTMGRNIQSNLRRGQCSDLRKPMLELQKAVFEGFEWKIPGDFKKVQKIVELDTLSDEDDDYEEEGEYAPIIVE